MRYKEFTFTNFKGIDELTLPLDGDVTTLIGLNESGKTTILEAIFCFSYGAEDLDAINPTLASLRQPEQWIPIAQRANFNDTVEIEARVSLDDADIKTFTNTMRTQHDVKLVEFQHEVAITERYFFENSRHTRTTRTWNLKLKGTSGRQRNVRTFGAKSPEWQAAVAELKLLLPRIWYFPNFLFELPERFILSAQDEADHEVRDRDRFYRGAFDQIIADLGYNANIDTHVIERLTSDNKTDQRSLSAILLDMSTKVTSTIFEGWNRIFGRSPTAQEVKLDAGVDSDSSPFLELKIKGPDGYYDLSERSLGFRWFFMFILMTSFSGNPGSNQKPLFLLDEPASNLHSSAQAELLKSFERLLDRCSLIYTTHSHHLINLRWLDSAFVVKNSALGSLGLDDYLDTRLTARTSITAMRYRTFVAQHPDQTSYFQPVLDLLEYRPSALEPIPEAVLVEGKSDFFLIRYMLDVIGVPGTLVTVPGGGAGSLDTAIRLHIGWAKNFIVLLDGDAEGKRQLARYVDQFGPMIRGRCVLLPDACGEDRRLEAEDLLQEADKQAILDAVYKPGTHRPRQKKALLNAVMELNARGEAVEIAPDTMALFERLVQSLTEGLGQM
jgi:ABC-type cobalamin/Fe3+-siderophores transport system ATPase subunit